MTHTQTPTETLTRLDAYLAERWPGTERNVATITVRDSRTSSYWYVQDDSKVLGEALIGWLREGERPRFIDGFTFIVTPPPSQFTSFRAIVTDIIPVNPPGTLTPFQQQTLEILRNLEGGETLPNMRSYVATCYSCTVTRDGDGARGKGDPELVKGFASADGTRAFILNHAGHRTKFSTR